MNAPAMNGAVAALRFFFSYTAAGDAATVAARAIAPGGHPDDVDRGVHAAAGDRVANAAQPFTGHTPLGPIALSKFRSQEQVSDWTAREH